MKAAQYNRTHVNIHILRAIWKTVLGSKWEVGDMSVLNFSNSVRKQWL